MIDGDDYTYDERYKPPGQSRLYRALTLVLGVLIVILAIVETLTRR